DRLDLERPVGPAADGVHERQLAGMAVLAEQVHLVAQANEGRHERRVVYVAPGPAEEVAVEDEDPHRSGILSARPMPLVVSAPVPKPQLYRLRSRADREIIRTVEPGAVYVDRETGDEFEVVGKVLPLAPSDSNLPWAVENLRL